jgi:hypothetical protein
MIAQAIPISDRSTSASAHEAALPTVWGLDPNQLYTRYWAALGVQVVRQGEPSQIVSHAELYLLTDPRPLVMFRLMEVTGRETSAINVLNWIKPLVLFVRLHDPRRRLGRQGVATDPQGRFAGFMEMDDSPDDPRMCRVVLTPDIEVARLWQSAPEARTGWRRLRRFTPRHDRLTLSLAGRVYDRRKASEIALFMRDLQRTWKRPDAVVTRAAGAGAELWKDRTGIVEPGAKVIGPVWVGAGRTVPADATVIGPQVLWDDPAARPATEPIQWLEIEPVAAMGKSMETAEGQSNGIGSIWKNTRRMIRRMTRS